MIELSQDDLDALARCFRLLAARGRQLRQAREAEHQSAAVEAPIVPEPAGAPGVRHDNDNEEWLLATGG